MRESNLTSESVADDLKILKKSIEHAKKINFDNMKSCKKTKGRKAA